MQDGNKKVSAINLRVFMSCIMHFYAEIRKIIFYYSLVDSWGNATIDFATGSWWSTVKKLCCFKQTSNTIAPIVNKEGILVYDAETKADIFNEFYASISTIDDPDSIIPTNNIATGPLLNNIIISQHDVYEALSKLKTNKATGSDNIGNLL